MAEIGQGLSGATSGMASGAAIGSAFGSPVIGAVAGGLIGGVAGLFTGNSQKKKAQQLAAEIDKMIGELGLPPDSAAPLLLEKLKQEGILTPDVEKAVNLEASKVAQIKEDPALKDAQMKGLQLISSRASAGLTPEDRAEIQKTLDQTSQQNRGQQDAIIQNMQERGQGGSGAELAARLAASQAATNRATSSGNEIAAAASRNALEAASRMGQLSGEIRGQDFGINQSRAQAEDMRNQMLYNNSVSLQQRNIDRANNAQAANLSRQQDVSDANTKMANAEMARQAQAKLDDYNAKLGLTNARIGAKTGNYNMINQATQAGANQFSNIMSGVNQGANTLASLINSNKKSSSGSDVNGGEK